MIDTWKEHISPVKLEAYKQLIDEGLIKTTYVTYDRKTKITTVEYTSEHSHEWILQELKKRAERISDAERI